MRFTPLREIVSQPVTCPACGGSGLATPRLAEIVEARKRACLRRYLRRHGINLDECVSLGTLRATVIMLRDYKIGA